MRYLVTKDFTDKHTGEGYKAGKIIDIDEERATEILSTCEVILPVEEIIKAEAANMAQDSQPEEEPQPEEEEDSAPKQTRVRRNAKKAAGDAK